MLSTLTHSYSVEDCVPFFLIFVLGVSVSGSLRKCPEAVQQTWSLLIRLFDGFLRNALSTIQMLVHGNTNVPGSIEQGQQLLYKRADILQSFPVGTWQREAYDDFIKKLLNQEEGNKTFPCVFAGKGHRNDDLHYMFLHSDDPSESRNVRDVATVLRAYLAMGQSSGSHTSLLMLAPRTKRVVPKGLEDYRREYWNFARALNKFDSKSWPEEIPQDTNSDQWCWCFEGVQCFMGVMSPAHQKRHSRSAKNLCIVYQPKWIFDVVFHSQENRDAAAEKVRGLIDLYDDIPVSPDVSHYGIAGSSEARQHFLLDVNEPSPCPWPNLTM